MLSIGVLGVGELTEKVVIGLRRGGFTGRVLLSPRNQARAEQLGKDWACEVMVDNQGLSMGPTCYSSVCAPMQSKSSPGMYGSIRGSLWCPW